MPVITRQTPPTAVANGAAQQAVAAPSGIVSAKSLRRSWMKVLLYGRSGVGKSTLAAQWPKPLLAFACEPRENGGADSLIGMDGVDVAEVQLKPLPVDRDNPTGPKEPDAGLNKVKNKVAWLQSIHEATGTCPYKSVTIDVTALQDIALAEIMGWDSVDVIKKRPRKGESGGVGLPQFMARADECIKVFRMLKDLPCHVVFVGQEKDHAKYQDEAGDPIVESKLLIPAQEKRFIAVSLGQASVEWLQNACQFICQLYMDAETRTIENVVTVGEETRVDKMTVPTGRFTRRLRTSYHPNYSARITVPGLSVTENERLVPEYIQAETPRAMYEALVRVSRGERVPEGYYP